MRRAFSDSLVEVADANSNMVFLTGDLGYQVFSELEARHPSKYINVGIAEAQMVSMATGMALDGFRPVIYSIGSFMTGRAFEPIRVAINYHQAPVLVVGAGGGYIYADSGVTHHCAEDVALMSTLPGMQIFLPGSPSEVRELMRQYFTQSTPAYMRIGRFGEPDFQAEMPIVLGVARRVISGKDIAVVTTGDCVIAAIEAVKKLKKVGMNAELVQYHTLTPFDQEDAQRLLQDFKHIVVVEEHFPQGALMTRFEHAFVQTQEVKAKLHRLGPEHELLLGAPKHTETKTRYVIDSAGIFSYLKNLYKDVIND